MVNGKEPELEPTPQFTISAKGDNLIRLFGSRLRLHNTDFEAEVNVRLVCTYCGFPLQFFKIFFYP